MFLPFGGEDKWEGEGEGFSNVQRHRSSPRLPTPSDRCGKLPKGCVPVPARPCAFRMPASDPWRPPAGPALEGAPRQPFGARLINKRAWETLSGLELPGTGARGGYRLGPDGCGQSEHAAPGWELAFPSPLWTGQRRERGRRELTRPGAGSLGESSPPRKWEAGAGYSNARFLVLFLFCFSWLSLAFKHCFMRVGGSSAEENRV